MGVERFSLTPEQSQALSAIRQKQHRQLMDEGIPQAIINAPVLINAIAGQREIAQRTLFYVRKIVAGDLSMAKLSIITADSPKPADFINAFILDPNTSSSMLILGRLDRHETGLSLSPYYVGLKVQRGKIIDLIPLNGIDSKHLKKIAELCDELDSKRVSGELGFLTENLVPEFIDFGKQTPDV